MKKLWRTLSILAGLACAGPAAAQLTDTCAVGVYRSPRQEYVSVTSAENGYNYTFFDGRMGNTASPRSRLACADRAVVVMLADSSLEIWPQAPLRMTPTRFASGGDTLAGLLVEPVGTLDRPPLVVMSHGSGKEPWVGGGVHWPFTLAGEGVAVFVYDKRGTGQSGGEFTTSLRQLARDLVAASAEARRLAGGRVGRFGLYGMSQGGWVAPLAAREAGAAFVAVGFGPAYNPPEDHDAMAVPRTLDVPQLWVLGGSDETMPPRLTLERLAQLRAEGKPVQVAVFPGADHQMLEFVAQPDGSRRYTRATDGAYRLLGDWMKGCLAPPYGTSTLDPPPPAASACP